MPPQASRSPAAGGWSKPMRLALRREDAARVLAVSEETFDRYIRPTLPVVRLGSVRVYPVAALEAWLLDHADAPTVELERAR